MKARKIGSAAAGVILGLVAIGVAVVSLNSFDASAEAGGRKKPDSVTARQIADRIRQHVTCPWLEAFVKEVPIKFVPAGDPFWTP